MNITQADIEGIRNAYRNTFLTEKRKQDLPVEKRKVAEDKKGESDLVGDGPGDKAKKPRETERFSSKAKGSDPVAKESVENQAKKIRKSVERAINSNMSVSNLFDKLYEEVMEDEDVLGIDDGGESEFGDEGLDVEGEDDSDDITLTISADVAKMLFDALKPLVDAGEEGGDDLEGLDDLGGEGEDEFGGEGEDEFGSFPEGVESSAAPNGVAKLTSPSSHKAALGDKVSSGPGDGKVTDKVGSDGDLGHALHNMSKGKDLATKKKYKVEAKKKNNPGDDAFGK